MKVALAASLTENGDVFVSPGVGIQQAAAEFPGDGKIFSGPRRRFPENGKKFVAFCGSHSN